MKNLGSLLQTFGVYSNRTGSIGSHIYCPVKKVIAHWLDKKYGYLEPGRTLMSTTSEVFYRRTLTRRYFVTWEPIREGRILHHDIVSCHDMHVSSFVIRTD